MQSLLKTNKIDIPQSSSFVQTNKSYSWPSTDLFGYTAITVRSIVDLSYANRGEIANIKSFTQLTANWDGYGAAPVSPEAIVKAIQFIHEINNFDIDAYLSSPGPNGEVMVQLKINKREIEALFYNDKSKYVLFKDNSFESQGTYVPKILTDLVNWLTQNE